MGPGSGAGTTNEYTFSFSRHDFVRGFQIRSRLKREAHATLERGRGEDRVRAAPAVSCAFDALENGHTSIQVQRKHSGLPCAMAPRLIRDLPGGHAVPPSLAVSYPQP